MGTATSFLPLQFNDGDGRHSRSANAPAVILINWDLVFKIFPLPPSLTHQETSRIHLRLGYVNEPIKTHMACLLGTGGSKHAHFSAFFCSALFNDDPATSQDGRGGGGEKGRSRLVTAGQTKGVRIV